MKECVGKNNREMRDSDEYLEKLDLSIQAMDLIAIMDGTICHATATDLNVFARVCTSYLSDKGGSQAT